MRSIERRLALVGVTVLTAGAGFLAIDQGPKSVSADSPTPSPTQPVALTPETVATRIAAEAASTVLTKQLEEQKRMQAILATNTAITLQLQPDPTKAPTLTQTPVPSRPTRSPEDASATADAIRLQALGREQAIIKATATAIAVLSLTPTPTYYVLPEISESAQAATATKIAEIKLKENKGGGFPLLEALTGLTALVTVGVGAVVVRRIRNRRGGGGGNPFNLPRNP